MKSNSEKYLFILAQVRNTNSFTPQITRLIVFSEKLIVIQVSPRLNI